MMLIFFDFIVLVATILACVINNLMNWFYPTKKPNYPPIRNRLLTKSITELLTELRSKKLTSRQLVGAYIERIKEVNPILNAVVEDRFEEALREAEHADQLMAKSTPEQLIMLFARYPLLGVPFTVKESCGVKGLSFAVGSQIRKNLKAIENGKVVENLRSAGCIPLLVSANPEFCMSLQTETVLNGRCLNPYDLRRTSAGSSGGEGALCGAGASLFGLGSDIAGSIRLPALFCGVFGHKPTGGLTSVQGHFPNSPTEPLFSKILQLGPITRFARDMPLLLQVMAGENFDKLKFNEAIDVKNIKIHYCLELPGLHPPTAFDIQLAIMKAIKCFEKTGLSTKKVYIDKLRQSLSLTAAHFGHISATPSIITNSSTARPSKLKLAIEAIKGFMGKSKYTKESVVMELFQSIGIASSQELPQWASKIKMFKQDLTNMLGDDGVLILPTFYTSAITFGMCPLNFIGIDYMALANILELPATHVPMGLDRYGRPIGFQVIAAPYQDKLCLQLAAELEATFGGWQPLHKHEFTD